MDTENSEHPDIIFVVHECICNDKNITLANDGFCHACPVHFPEQSDYVYEPRNDAEAKANVTSEGLGEPLPINARVSTTEPQNEVTLFGVNYDGALDERDYCPRCDGSGWIPTTPLDGIEHYEFGSNGTKTCPICAGTGR